MSVALADCGPAGLADDLMHLNEWVSIFSNKTLLIATISKNMLLHRKKIETDIGNVTSDWSAHEFFLSGTAAADLAYDAIGPVE